MSLNRIARLIGPREFEITTEKLEDPGAAQALVRILACGVCASELHAWEGTSDYPVLMGHEPVGIVERTGPGVNVMSPGDLVTGRFGPAFADYAIVDQLDAVIVPAGIRAEAAMGEPLGCVVEARRRTQIAEGDHVAILGAGYMGLLMLELVTIGGAGKIVVVDPRADARAAALERGAGGALAPEDAGVVDLASKFDVVVEASGTQAGLDLATALVREHGVVSILGFHQGRERIVDVETWNWKAIDVVNAHVRRRELLNDAISKGLELIGAGRINPGSLLTHRFELEDVGRAFEHLADKPNGFIKAIVINERT